MRRAALAVLLAVSAACAPPPPVVVAPTAPAHPDFVFPAAPAGTPPATLERLDRAWRLLQSNDPAAAEREFATLLRADRTFAPAVAGQGYVELARRRTDEALAAFERATAATPAYAPALVGRALTLLRAGRDDDALAAFEAALAADATLPDVATRIELLRVQQLQDRVSRAERAAAAGRWDEAREAYLSAIAASPESPFLHRDLAADGIARRPPRCGPRARAAGTGAGRATTRATIVIVADGPRGPRRPAPGRWRPTNAPRPSTRRRTSTAAIARLRERARVAALPAEYHAIATAPAATRADLAALLGVRLGAVLAAAPQRQTVVTDVRGHWAQQWIEATARSGAMEVFSNYTFQPATRLRRADVADVVSRVLSLVTSGRAAVRWDLSAVDIADVPPGHLAYPAVRRAVAAGVMRLDDGAFRPLQPVTGAELAGIIDRLEGLRGAQ